MRLEPYTPEQTDKLLSDIDYIVKHAISINDIALNILRTAHSEYIDNFKWKWHQWKPYNEDEFVAHLGCDSRIEYRTGNLIDEYSSSPVELFKYFIFYGLYVNWLEKNNLAKFTEFELKILKIASVTSNFLTNDLVNKKYKALVKYAHRPFEFDEDDIYWLESVEYTFNKLEKFVGETQWTTNLQKINP